MSVSKHKKVSYRDDPDAISMHTTPENDVPYSDEADAAAESSEHSALTLPTYSDAVQYHDLEEGNYPHNGLNNRECHFSTISRSKSIFQKKARTRIAGEYVRIQHPPADTKPEYLQEWVEYMARKAPTPYIVVSGTHSERQRESNGKDKQVDVTDFEICINMRNYLWPNFRVNDPTMMTLETISNGVKTWRGTVLKRRAPGANGDIEVGQAKPTLQEWCHRYCASASKTRIFRLSRTVVGMDREYLRDMLTSLIRATNYKGHLDISFPVADRAVDIYSNSLLNDWRLTTWICWVFYLTFLWIFTWPIVYFSTKRYHVVKAEWAFSKADENHNRTYTTVSEQLWIDKYGPAVRQLACDRYQGVVGDDVLKQVLARPETHRAVPAEFGGTSAAVGAAIGSVRGGFNAANQINNLLRFAGGTNDQVGWGYDT